MITLNETTDLPLMAPSAKERIRQNLPGVHSGGWASHLHNPIHNLVETAFRDGFDAGILRGTESRKQVDGWMDTLTGRFPMAAVERADFALKQMLDGLHIDDQNRESVRSYLASHFEVAALAERERILALLRSDEFIEDLTAGVTMPGYFLIVKGILENAAAKLGEP